MVRSGISTLRTRGAVVVGTCLAVLAGFLSVPATAAVAAPAAVAATIPSSTVTITNDQFWHDTDGNPIYSQGGGIFDFPDPVTGVLTHYWYGVHYVEAEKYYADPSHKYEWASVDGRGFVSIDVYSSLDLAHWKFENSVLTESELATMDGGPAGWLGRMGVAYVPSIGKYALLVQENNVVSGDDRLLALTSTTPTGKFTNPTRIDMNNFGTGFTSTGDQTVFVDDDGKGYLIYSKPNGRNKLFVAEIIGAADGSVTLGQYKQIYSGAGREGDCMFKYNGKYYFAASDLYGWNASNAYYLVSDSIFGDYVPTNSTNLMQYAGNDYSHVTQTGFFYTLHGSSQDTVIFAGDRWADFAGNGLGYNQWVPLSFDGNTPVLNSLSSWDLNTTTGTWSAGLANNYVANPSFEADRVAVSPVRGWTYSGTTAAILNQADNAGRVGNFHLAFSSSSASSASVSQNLALNPAIAPPDGTYTLTAYARHAITDANASFGITVTSGSNSKTIDLKASVGSTWQQVTLPNIRISGGQATLSIATANVPGGQWANVDDLVLTRNTSTNTSLAALSVGGVPIDLADFANADATSVTVPGSRAITASSVLATTVDAGATAAVEVVGGSTAAAEPTVRVTVTSEIGTTRTYTVHVVAQASAVAVAGLSMDRDDYWFRSDRFAVTSTGAAPTVALSATVMPADATDSAVRWTSSAPTIATVDANGVVTAVRAGTALITATSYDGGFAASTIVHVPSLSESFDSVATGSAWIGAKVPAYAGYGAGTVIADGARGNTYSISMSGSGLRALGMALPTTVSGDTVVVDADWNVGAPTNSNGAYLTITDASGNRYVTLVRTNGGQLRLATGGVSGDTTVPAGTALGAAFAANSAWYSVHAVLDMRAKQAMVTVLEPVSGASAVQTVPFAAQNYTGSVKSIEVISTRASGTMSWTTKVDNLAVYAAPADLGIEIASPVVTSEYVIGDVLDQAGLGVNRVTGLSHVALAPSEYTLSGFDSSTTGTRTVTVTAVAAPRATATFDVVVRPVDRTQLIAELDRLSGLVPADYTETTWSAYAGAVDSARAVRLDDNATRVEVDAATAQLRAAREALVRRPVAHVSAPPVSTPWGTAASVTITVTAEDATPTGAVELREGATVLARGTLAGGSAVLTLSRGLPAGVHDLDVVYAGDELVIGAATSTDVTVVLPAPWSATATYQAGDRVTYGGRVFVAGWYSHAEVPGASAYGSWRELALTADGDTVWTSSQVFQAGDTVVLDGRRYLATWYTRNERPGTTAYGSWQEISTAADGTAIWTSSRIFQAGDVVVFDGSRYVAQWYSRNLTPGGASGAWRLAW